MAAKQQKAITPQVLTSLAIEEGLRKQMSPADFSKVKYKSIKLDDGFSGKSMDYPSFDTAMLNKRVQYGAIVNWDIILESSNPDAARIHEAPEYAWMDEAIQGSASREETLSLWAN